MRLVYCGDVVGRSGRDAIAEYLPEIRRRLGLDFAIVNGENAAHGFGLTERICRDFYDAGADVVTTGNHVWDQREIISYIENEVRVLRPLNYPAGTPGNGFGTYESANGQRVLVAQVMGRLFMDSLDDPFPAIDSVLENHRLGASVDCIFVDIHGEGTSEKMAMGHFLDGRVSMVAGTHTHVPTADAQVLPGGTGYLTDVGMCGDYDSVIGMKKKTATDRFLTKMPTDRLEPSEGPATLCGVFLETDDKTGLAARVAPVRVGGRLAETWPD
jgi:metallophosphoesterase (TIGR00282 family)